MKYGKLASVSRRTLNTRQVKDHVEMSKLIFTASQSGCISRRFFYRVRTRLLCDVIQVVLLQLQAPADLQVEPMKTIDRQTNEASAFCHKLDGSYVLSSAATEE